MEGDENGACWKGLVFQCDWQFCLFHHGWLSVEHQVLATWHSEGVRREVTKAKIKHVTTYQHTLAEGSSTPASCPLSKSPWVDPPAGNPGNRRKWGRRPLHTAGLFWCCRVGFQDPHMAPNHILKKRVTKSVQVFREAFYQLCFCFCVFSFMLI